jgi:hypothetical protein
MILLAFAELLGLMVLSTLVWSVVIVLYALLFQEALR